MNWYIEVLKKYMVFEGRSRRQEYWMFLLVNLIITFVLALLSFGTLETIYGLAILIPSLAVTVRRLHDTDRSGWWILISLIPFLGALVLLYFCVLDSQPGSNQYGPNPKSAVGDAEIEAEYETIETEFEDIDAD